MSLAYFQSPAIGLSASIVEGGQSLVKRAIIAIEGTHICNRGNKYEMPPAFIQILADNTNAEIANGRIVSLYREHNKRAESCFGDLMGMVECRPVLESDLPNPAAKGMLGKLAIFANANIKKHLDLVASGAIKALSPGIDMVRKLIFEVSEVPVASMPGVALFRYPDLVKFGYAEIKAEGIKYQPMRDRVLENLDNLIAALRMFDAAGAQMAAGDLTERQESFEEFVADLREIFGIPSAEEAQSQIDGVGYSNNPYDRQVIQHAEPRAGFSFALDAEEKESVIDEVAAILDDEPTVKPKIVTMTGTRGSKRRSEGKPK